MKKLVLFCLMIAVLAVSACGVKSDLKRSSSDPYPRNYPVH